MAQITTKGLSELIGLIHEAGLEPALWPESIDRIRLAMTGTAALLFTPQHGLEAGGLAIPANLSTAIMARYAEKYHQLDLWTQAGVKRKLFVPGTVATDDDLLPRRLLLSSPYYREFLEPANISRLCTSVIFGQDEPAVLPTVISIYRGLDAPPFGRGAKNLLRLLMPHLSRSLGLMFRLRGAEQKLAASLAALDKLSCGIVLFGQYGNVVHSNQIASALLAENDGLTLEGKVPHGPRLRTSSEARTTSLNRLVAIAVSAPSTENCSTPRGMHLPRMRGRPPIVINISPLPPNHEFECGTAHVLAIGFLFEAILSTQPDTRLLAEIYGLTTAETRLVGELCSGWMLAQIGEHHGVSTETLKSQLKSIFAKTGTHRQIEVVRLASALAIQR
jgi:DNA-binding CsgD family transcriptional regulator